MKKPSIFILLLVSFAAVNAQTNQEKFDAFKKQAKKDYSNFREKANKDYADFIEKTWKTYTAFSGVEQPKEKPIPLRVLPEKERNKPLRDNKKTIKDIIKPEPVTPQPMPLEPIQEERKDEINKQKALELQEKLNREKHEQAEKERQRNERLEKEKQERLEKERLKKEKLEQEKKKKQEKKIKEKQERQKQKELEKQQKQESLEKKRKEKELLEKEKQECLEKERLEKERLEQERKEKEKLENERKEKEKLEHLEQERLEQERIENERKEKERLEKENINKLEKPFSFQFYGTDIKTTFFDNYKYTLNGTSEKNIADGWKTLSLPKYNHLINECLKIREDYRLNDWAYLQMLDEFSSNVMGKKCNEATLLMAYIYCQSGYSMRLGEYDGKLYMLYSAKGTMPGTSYYVVDADIYYLYKGENLEYLRICEASFPNEQKMSFQLKQEPLLATQISSYRTLQSERYPEVKANVRVNKNLIDFYNNYPTSFFNGDFGTRWAIYANTPLSNEVKNTLYPELKKILQGKSKAESAEMLLNFVQTSLVYEYDDTIWGGDRAFFAEETLFYPYADCEDRAILFSRLAKDLLDIDAVLIYYPGHLSTAICINSSEVRGDYFEMDNKRYYMADPTYPNAPIGLQMPEVRDEPIKVILLDN